MDHHYRNLQEQIQKFIHHTKSAIESYKEKSSSIENEILEGIAESIYQLEYQSDKIMRAEDDEMRLEMQLIQNFIHNPVYFSKGKITKKLSIFHAAKTFYDLKDLSEMKAIVQACAGNKESFKTLMSDLSMIYQDVNSRLKEQK